MQPPPAPKKLTTEMTREKQLMLEHRPLRMLKMMLRFKLLLLS